MTEKKVDEDMSDDDSMESDAEEDEVTLAKVEILDQKLESSPYDYQSHVERIALLRKSGEFEKLSTARRCMAKIFPMTKELWLSWLEDEQKFAESEEEHRELGRLFETAVKDYLCPEIWLEYAQYSIRFIGHDGGIEKIRSILEKALSATGLHVSKGTSLWEAYREIENAILVTLQPSAGSVTGPEQNDMITQQMSRIGLLFSRQLAIPLLDMEETMEEYKDWRKASQDGEISQLTMDSYNKALKNLDELKPFEEALETEEVPSLDTYKLYIEHERKTNDPARVQCIYERAIASNCLNSDLWSQYLTYLSRTLKTGPIVLSASERAVRNCPWTAELWKNYLTALERNHCSYEKRESVFNEALSVGFSSAGDYAYLWQAWCDQARRRFCDCSENEQDELAETLRKTFNKATSHLLDTILPAFRQTGDPDCTLWCYWAKCEAGCLKNVEKARKIMDDLMQDDADARRNWNIWKEYYDLERSHGDLDHARNVLRQAAQSSAADDGSAEVACSYLIRFERENGSLEDLDDSTRKVEARLSKVNKRKEKAVMQQQERKKKWEQNKHSQKKWNDNKSKKEKPNNKRSNEQSSEQAVPEKRKKQDVDKSPVKEEGFKAPSSLPLRFVKSSSKQPEDSVKTTIKSSTGPPPGFKQKDAPSTSGESPKTQPPSSQRQDERSERTPESEERTIFVSNLSYSMESVEEKLKKLFASCGLVTSVRLAHSNKGGFRGFGYVEFESKSSVQGALKLDRQLLEGRPMFVSPNVDKQKQPNFKVFKYETGMEKHKLFVSGLNFDTKEEQLREVFAAHGTLKSLRIVTARNGKSKGLAYVEYEKEADASQALIKTDQTVLDGFTIKVAISNPPARNRQSEEKGRVLGGGERTQQPVGGRGRGRTQLSLVPRSLQKSGSKEAGKVGKIKDKNDNDVQMVEEKPMSNKDFSKLFAKN